MAASKSSRARNARAGAQSGTVKGSTAKGGGRNGPAGNNAAARNGRAGQNAAGRNGNGRSNTAARNGAAARNGSGGAGRTGTVTARGSATERAQRGRVVAEDLASTEPRTAVPMWMQLTTFVLALAGLGVSAYLTVAHFTEATLAGCSETKGLVDCTKVTTSPQSYVFGIPVAVLGLAFFVFVVAIMSPWAWRSARREIHLARIASLVAGIGFVLYLLYAELFTIGSICLYCTSVHVITFVLFVLTAFAAAAWGLNPARRED
jgi:uncharacterized membrane protein